MKKICTAITFVLLLTISAVYAQEQIDLRGKANQLYLSYNYANSAKIYLKLANGSKPKLKDLERLADCYEKINDYEAAENWYARVVQDSTASYDNLLRYGSVLKSNARYAEAKKVLQKYIIKVGPSKIIANEIAGCDSALVWMAKPTPHKIKNQRHINTPLAQFGVFVNKDKVYFVKESDGLSKTKYGRSGNPFLEIYNATGTENDSLKNPKIDPAKYNNNDLHTGPIISNKAGNVFYVTKTYEKKKGEVSKEQNKKYRTKNLELNIYTLDNGKWKVTPFPYNNVKKHSVGHASLSADEKTLYFVSDMDGGLGGTDIWYCILESDGTWGKPQNVGNSINTEGDEMFPNSAAENTLYFSTNGWPGMGELDIFSSTGNKNTWTKPINLRFPLNSTGDDFAFSTNGLTDLSSKGYLSSNRKDGMGNDDIYSFSYTQPKLILVLNGTVFNKKTNELLDNATVSLFANGRKLVAKQSSKVDGTFTFEIDRDLDYSVLGQKLAFYADSTVFTTKNLAETDTINLVLKLNPLFEVGKLIALKNILYNFDKDNIREDAAKILDELVLIMRDNPTLEIELGSHTDSRGVDIYNIDLSQRRAKSAVEYLIKRGIDRSRMIAKGYGETKLLNKCSNGVNCTVAEHQVNRRTEFKIMKY